LPFALVPSACFAAHNLVRCNLAFVARVPSFLRERLTWFVSEEGTQMALAFAAISEVMVGVTAPINIFMHGMRVLPVSILYVQYLFKRYNSPSPSAWWTRTAVKALTERADSLFHHRFCPAPVGKLYEGAKGLMLKFGSAYAR